MAIHHFRHSGGGASSSDFNDRAVMQCDNDKFTASWSREYIVSTKRVALFYHHFRIEPKVPER